MELNVGVSNRHCHLRRDTFVKLFGDVELTKRNELNQIGEYASDYTVTIKTDKDQIDKVRVLGPNREYDQIEISLTDAYKLGVKPPVRSSGKLEGSEGVTLIGTVGTVNIEYGLIIAERHVHMNPSIASELGVKNGEAVAIQIEGAKRGVIEAFAKISDNGFFEIHLDTDDANAFMLKNGDKVELVCGK